MAALALATLGAAAMAYPCASYTSVGATENCSGAAASTYLYWRGSDTSAFSSTASFSGPGDTSVETVAQAGGFMYEQALAWGGLSAATQTTGSAPGGSGLTSASAAFSTGTLRFFGTAMSDDIRFPVADSFAASAALADLLSFVVPKSIVDPFITFTLRVDGTVSGDAPHGPGVAQAQLQVVSLGGQQYGYDYFQSSTVGTFSQVLTATFDPSDFARDGGDEWLLDLKLNTLLFGQGNTQYTFDFSHTAQLGLAYSDGITFRSEGGLFAVTAVPEPETYAILLAGLALLAPIARRRRWPG